MIRGLALGLLLMCVAMPAVAQDADQVDDIIVVARRSQTPIWEVSRGDRSLILVGNIRGLPRDFEWSPSGLEAATARADRIMYPPVAPLRLLAEPGGVLDGLEAQGFEVRGPDWKTGQAD